MLRNILKNDLRRKKTMNLILFLFIILCATFMSSSVNNMFTTMNALDYFSEKTNSSDYNLIVSGDPEIQQWIENNKRIKALEKNPALLITTENLTTGKGEIETNNTNAISNVPKTYNKVLDENNKVIQEIEPGKMGMSISMAHANKLKKGDTVEISMKGKKKTLTLQYIYKDMVYGSSFMGFERMLISDKDFDYFEQSPEAISMTIYSLMTDDIEGFEVDMNKQPFPSENGFGKDMVKNIYILDMMIMAILIIVSMFLIAIALVILRFTIVFTIQEDYKEIGIMKAIGIKNRGIKGIYMTKYLFLAVVGSAVGVVCSVPFGNLMIRNAQENIAMESSQGNLFLNIGCGVLIVLMVMLFCYLSSGKINKLSAIEAIRQGSTGKRFLKKTPVCLHKSKRTAVPIYLAVNDILSNIKTYLSLLVVFILGTLLIILPLNASNTLKDDSIISSFGMARSDVVIDNNKEDRYVLKGKRSAIEQDLNEMEKCYADGGVDINLYYNVYFMLPIYKDTPAKSKKMMINQSHGAPKNSYPYIGGTEPLRENELAMTQIAMDNMDLAIGDTVIVVVGAEKKKFVITGSFESMNMMGESLRLSEKAKIDYKQLGGLFIQGDLKNRKNLDEQRERMKEITPGYTIKNMNEISDDNLGSIRDAMDQLTIMILLVIIFINCLIVVLMVKALLTRNISEIALLKSIGFTDGSIRFWQLLRILIVILIAALMGILLSHLMNTVVNSLTFGLMGAPNIESQVNVLQVYVLYPIILMACIGLAATFSTAGVKKIDIKEVNQTE